MTDATFGPMAAAPLTRVLALGREVLAHRPAGVLADLDGTLAPIVDDPFAVQLAPGAADALAALASNGVLVGVVTGRAAADARRILGIDSVLVVGNHGIEWLEPGAAAPALPDELAGLPAELDRVGAAMPHLEGVQFEHKGVSASVHYRNAPYPDAARDHIRGALAPVLPEHLELRDGRMIVEIRARGLGDKGTAVRAIVGRYRLRGLLILGDDLTDLDMFHAAHALHRARSLDAAAVIAVGGVGGEVPSEVLDAADAVVASPAQLVAVLRGLVAPNAISGGASGDSRRSR
jgi:trehalose 6-phosphate phosphatase